MMQTAHATPYGMFYCAGRGVASAGYARQRGAPIIERLGDRSPPLQKVKQRRRGRQSGRVC
jgi:hypothetical protein